MQLSPNQALTGKPYKQTAISRERLDSIIVWHFRQIMGDQKKQLNTFNKALKGR